MANITTDKNIDYIAKDFTSTVDALISYATVNFSGAGTSANRLWTNFNADSFSRNWLEIVAYVSDLLFFYFDNQATQAYLQTATVRSAVTDIAKQFGFTPASATSATGNATFTVTGAGTINRGFRVQSSNGQQFFLTNNITATAAGDYTGTVLQGIIKTENFASQGLQNEEINLAGPNVIRDLDNLNPQDISPQVTVNGNDYFLVDSFIRFNGSDQDPVRDSLGNLIGGGGRVFVLDERPDGTPFIRFGDGIFGRKLQSGETINITYRTGGGSVGNIPEESLTTLIDTNSIITAVTNNADFSGGSDEQTIEELRELIPASLRTLDRAVAEQDYSDLLETTFSEVFSASAEPNDEDPGVDLNIYVIPQGTGIQKVTSNTLLVNKLSKYLDRRKTVTTQFEIRDAFGIDIVLTFEVFISDTSSKDTIRRAIIDAMEAFFNLSTGGSDNSGIGFAEPVLIKDMCSILEEITGIERFEIKRLSYKPRIDESVIGLTTDYISSGVTIFPNVNESEWLLAAAGSSSETQGASLFDNTSLIGFSYNSGTGVVTYDFSVDLSKVGPGDIFEDGAGATFTILAVDIDNNSITILENQTVNTTVNDSSDGSIVNGDTSFQSFKAFKKTRAIATNLSVNSITDNNLDLSVASGTGSAIGARTLLDNENIYLPNQYSTGNYFLVDGSGNIWEIESNDSNTFQTSITAINDASITSVSGGDYKIVKKVTTSKVVFKDNTFNIQYNSHNTVFSAGAQFNQIGTIGDEFAISDEQSNIGNLGTKLDLIAYDSGTGEIRLNESPDLEGINADYVLIDSEGQSFNITGVDNRSKPSIFYDTVNHNTEYILKDSGNGAQIAQGFQVDSTDTYAIVSLYLKRQGNIVGNLTAKIVDDDGTGLPDLSSPVATSNTKVITDISDQNFEEVIFNFTTPPTLNSSTQYHLVLAPDTAYDNSFQDGVKSFDNTTPTSFTYTTSSGVIQYSSSVDLSNVEPGHFFIDGDGNLFSISSVNDDNDEIFLDTGLSITETTNNDGGSVIIYDRIQIGVDDSSPSYSDGEFSVYDGSNWSNSTLGPNQLANELDAIFSVEGTKTLKVESNLTPALGTGATVSTRYYDDNNEISLILGISSGSITSATDVDATGKGTVAGVPDRAVDTFIFRTSRYSDDVVNLRSNEIPRINENDIKINIFGGVDA